VKTCPYSIPLKDISPSPRQYPLQDKMEKGMIISISCKYIGEVGDAMAEDEVEDEEGEEDKDEEDDKQKEEDYEDEEEDY
jgi:hypothetical protein